MNTNKQKLEKILEEKKQEWIIERYKVAEVWKRDWYNVLATVKGKHVWLYRDPDVDIETFINKQIVNGN